MGDIDDVLSQLKAEYEQKQEEPEQPAKEQPTSGRSDRDSWEDNLNFQDSSTNVNPQQENSKSSPIDNLLAQVKQESEQPGMQQQSRSSWTNINSQPESKLDNSLLDELKQEFQERERLEEESKQQQLQQEKQRQLEQEKRRRKALAIQAQEWLKDLNPKSDEGLWFEEFSYAYESKLEAAIDYLQAIKET
jgi:hypothetical protein